ncbi:hypothetical protein A3C20_03575 [Candidatus Kaiserbacteria bacterium RIFCSPHIGHO2_02_FULL_55_25]|uniref:Uncharacterized protein n=1 Tax=Candidatus Kaiserbacteria bacterium RIFCSPHIGHO2_02_FULL_55_25 TaxID=1798498 RepID=A0A1F6E6R6_9BACT|nr:MAG: hypothetical protein A2764_02280 [Candidatus Kaiserbacteria bacterium RIFCSPHIGHO2_01_FULL_55_79]OGG69393.1 MAG: hypothetical protein A3C20_03575 [Candidatus Kaiserbacteria bacterium RIFCSPHIGHO2_02_FULL_55_25]OGG78703.1 MAG: hypothetical protein A3F56_00630 [Candidatus Kaiserbacteria bacterium RIFCSPHIGHO2_12_FULL_55_13]OGG82666.1 MAG: hypothetical protein A3A42_02235 [Candidatus Kaiserbacteria bacterium RIFCSPLOWO2_01_FULL_55_25]
MKMLSLRSLQGLVVLGIFLVLPLLAHAQSTDLNETIRAALYADPRTSAMSQAQVDAMVAALSQRVQQKGITPADITWRPVPPSGFASVQTCNGFPVYLCAINDAFGFEGPDYFIPIWLAAAALLFLLINALQTHHGRQSNAAAPPAPGYLQN